MNAPWWNGEPDQHHGNPHSGGAGVPYICTVCDWQARGGIAALEHHVSTGHEVRGRHWPESWPDAQFSGDPRRLWKGNQHD